MDATTTVYELELAPGRTVRFRELTAEEFEGLVTGMNGGDPDYGWQLTQAGLRRSLVADGAEELSYTKLVGPLLSRRFTTRQLLMLRQAWDAVHLPTAEDQARVRGMRAVVG